MLSVKNVTSRTVVVSWELDDSPIPIDGFEAHFVVAKTRQVIANVTLPADVFMLTLRDLQPNTTYRFSIRPINLVVTSEYADLEFTTISTAG